MKSAISNIARGYTVNENGTVRRLRRDELINMAREACDRAGITYEYPNAQVSRTPQGDAA